jgi:hypothetical protein
MGYGICQSIIIFINHIPFFINLIFQAEPCHILVIPLNTNRENVVGAQERLQKLCKYK